MEIIQQICEELVNPVVAIKVDAFLPSGRPAGDLQ